MNNTNSSTILPGVIAKENKFSMSSKGYYSNNFENNVKPTKVIETLKMENNSQANVSSNFDKMQKDESMTQNTAIKQHKSI